MKEDTKEKKESVNVVETNVDAKNGQEKCPKCGSTDISLNINNGKLRCNFCRHEFEPSKADGLVEDIGSLEGVVVGSGATDIEVDSSDMITLKCTSCGAEVVVDTQEAPQARCHWCRNTLSLNEKVSNGAVPDVVLPFQVKKDDAKAAIEKFVGKRKFFANPTFKKEFTTNNIMGVYLPYMLIDVNGHAKFSGYGEIETGKHYETDSQGHQEVYYDADCYEIDRDFDILIHGLSVESSADKLDVNSKTKTTNIINAIMPFDVENCVKFNANYIKGYTSEKRDVNMDALRGTIDAQSKDIARFAANDTAKQYDRGIRWEGQDFKAKGEQWKAAYLPVWLYSYQQKNGDKSILHYVAVNARTKETMGSVPIHMPKLIFMSFLVELLGVLMMLNIDFDYNYIFLALGFIFFFVMKGRYRNKSARHHYENQTQKEISNLKEKDDFYTSRTHTRDTRIQGVNYMELEGTSVKKNLGKSLMNSIVDQSSVASIVKDVTKKGK